jgi:hypothetical protein
MRLLQAGSIRLLTRDIRERREHCTQYKAHRETEKEATKGKK